MSRRLPPLPRRHEQRCVLCRKLITHDAHNPEPLARMDDGLACETCHRLYVIPARVAQAAR